VSSGNFVTAKPVGVVNGVDFQHTARCARWTPAASGAASTTTRWSAFPDRLLSHGDVFNCTLEDVATQAAIALGADKLIFLVEKAARSTRAGGSSPSSP
jgi:amino-acid N-acetyltransferase